MYQNQKRENLAAIREWVTGAQDGFAPFFPRYLQIEHTTFCNAQCIMCNHFFLGNQGAAEIDPRVIEKLEPILPCCELIMMNGDGEPFLCSSLEHCLKLYRKYGVRISTNTNLCAGSEEKILALAPYFDCLNVSCDGVTAETFERIRKNLKFSVFTRNLRALRTHVPKLPLHLDFVMMAQNLHEVPAAVEFAREYGFSSVQLNLMNPNPLIGNAADSILQYPEAAAYYLGAAAQKAEAYHIKLTAPFALMHPQADAVPERELAALRALAADALTAARLQKTEHLRAARGLSDDHLSIRSGKDDLETNAFCAGRECAWALERCYIDVRGNVTTCCFNVHHYMGNLIEAGSFEAVWNGESYRMLRMQMAKGMLPQWCADCPWLSGVGKHVQKGTPVEAFQKSGL